MLVIRTKVDFASIDAASFIPSIALIGDLPVLVLDEPTNDLDPENRRLVWDILLEKNGTLGATIIWQLLAPVIGLSVLSMARIGVMIGVYANSAAHANVLNNLILVY